MIRIEDLTPAQLREAATRLLEETADRGVFVRLAAACKARELRTLANKKDPQ